MNDILHAYIGLDPGQGGGFAMILPVETIAMKMPETERDLFEHVGDLVKTAAMAGVPPHRLHASLEQVHSSPQMGVSSAFKFGVNYGQLRMTLVALGIPFDNVTPQRWQKLLGCRSGGDKNVTKRRAQELFPLLKVTHALADALLLAEYCRRVRIGAVHADAQVEVPKARTRFKVRKPTQAALF